MDPTDDQTLNDCGCCEGLTAETPVEIYNRPGLPAIFYRAGTHPQFKRSMLAALSAASRPALGPLNTRADDDFTIALLDAWAVVADILTFYQERIANEAYLRTATERLSLLHLARLIGYELRPGVAARADLAFTIDTPPALPAAVIPGLPSPEAASTPAGSIAGVPEIVVLPAGLQVQSVPEPGEKAQTFETVETIEARAAWNALSPRQTTPHPLTATTDTLFFAGTATNLRAGDGVLFQPDGGGNPVFGIVTAVTVQASKNRTEARIARQSASPISKTLPAPSVPPVKQSDIARELLEQGTITAEDLVARAKTEGFEVEDVFDNLAATRPPAPTAVVFRARAAVFGHNAPAWESLPNNQRYGEYADVPDPATPGSTKREYVAGPYQGRQNTWNNLTLDDYPPPPPNDRGLVSCGQGTCLRLNLDTTYPNVAAGGLVVLRSGSSWGSYEVQTVSEVSMADFALSAKVTRVELSGTSTSFSAFTIRDTTVFIQSETLPLAPTPLTGPVAGSALELEGWIPGLHAGQRIALRGELAEQQGVWASEVVTVAEVVYDFPLGVTRLTLDPPPANAYVRATLSANANVARATHGETRSEILGSGDARQPFQKFTLRQPPLTYVRPPDGTGAVDPAAGVQSTLEVRVNDVLWHEVPTFYGHGPDEHIYITRTADDGTTTVEFGDGVMGARLPTGQDNVRATYRRGSGPEGLVKAGQISLLMTRPQGLRDVTNPLPSEGASAADTRDDARANAPLTVMTLDRIVSLRDYEDFARAYAGVAKALATWTWDGERRGILVTVSGPGGEQFTAIAELVAAMEAAGEPGVPIQVKPHRRALFTLAAGVHVHPDFLPEVVVDAVRAALRSAFSFEARAFGQPVMLSEVIAVMQAVPGVVAVQVTQFYRTDKDPAAIPPDFLPAALPKAGASAGEQGAELLTLEPGPLTSIGALT